MGEIHRETVWVVTCIAMTCLTSLAFGATTAAQPRLWWLRRVTQGGMVACAVIFWFYYKADTDGPNPFAMALSCFGAGFGLDVIVKYRLALAEMAAKGFLDRVFGKIPQPPPSLPSPPPTPPTDAPPA